MSNKIKIYGDIESASVFFINSTVDPKPMGVVEASAHPTKADRVVIKRNDRFKRDRVSFRVLFRQLNINRICNKQGQDLVATLGYDRQQVIDYINGQSNLSAGTSGGDGAGTDMIGVDICVKLDDTSTSIMFDTGHEFGVNTIKAVENNGVIDIKSELGDLTHFTNLEVGRVCGHDGNIIGGGINDVINYLNELFTVGPFEQVVISDPDATLIADVGGTDDFGVFKGVDALDPITDDLWQSMDTGTNDAGYLSNETMDQAGEYFTFDIRGKGTYMFGFVHTQDSYDAGKYVGNATYADPTVFCNNAAGTNANHGFQWAFGFHVGNAHASWTLYGANTAYRMGEAWYDHNNNFDMKDDWNANQPVKMKVGLDFDGYFSVWSKADEAGEWKLHARTTYAAPQGSSYKLGIKLMSNTSRINTMPKYHLLEPAAPTMYFRYIESPDNNFQYPLFATQEEADYYELEESGVDNGSHTHLFVDDPTNTIWYMPNTAHEMNGAVAPSGTFKGQPILYTEITSLSDADLAPSSFIIPQQYMMEGATLNLQLSPQDVSYTTSISGQPSWLSLSNGYLLTGTAGYVSADTDYNITVTRTNSYGSTTSTFVLTVQDDIIASQLANITTSYGNTLAPNTVFDDEGFAGKLNTPISQGQEISWTHRDYTVGGFLTAGAESNFNNGVDVENQVNWDLRFSNWTATLMHTFSKGWAVGGSQNVGNLDGSTHKMVYRTDGYVEYYLNDVLKYTSANAFTGDKYLYLMTPVSYNVPIDLPVDFTISTTGAGTTTPPVGFTSPLLSGEMGGPEIMGNGASSAVTSTFTLGDNNRLIVSEVWVEQNILPYFDSGEDKVFFGVPKASTNWNAVTINDFEAVVRLQQISNNSHKSLLYGGAGVPSNEVVINSGTDAAYNYAFEYDGTDLHIIAGTYGDLITQPAIKDGGTFSRVVTIPNVGLGAGPLDFVIATNEYGQVKLNPAFLGVTLPVVPTDLTSFNKAIVFDGSSERAMQSSNRTDSSVMRISDGDYAVTNGGKTTASTNGKPFATAIVFKSDRHASNQHIWNFGEGSNGDNIYLKTDASGYLYFGWGLDGQANECRIKEDALNSNRWYGVYVAHTGARVSGGNATPSILANEFDIYVTDTNSNMQTFAGGNRSTPSRWINTGNRMNRSVTGDLTIGGRGSNRSFHGKVASFVTTTLKLDDDMPTEAEAKMMIQDPIKWMQDYKTSNNYRRPDSPSNSSNFSNNLNSAKSTQVWLMGDGANDSYSNMIRNQVMTSDQNDTKLNLISMVSNDIETVNINGLT